MIIEIFIILQLILLFITGVTTAYYLFFSISGLFYKETGTKATVISRKFVILIPAYKEDAVIVEVVADALRQQYPKDCFDVVVIADSFKMETLQILHKMPIRLLEVQFELSTKAKALNKAMSLLPDDYDVALVMDADNLMETDLLKKLNQAFEKKFKAVQCHRMAKNTNTSLAVLDAISEEISNHIFRKGHRAVGLSSGLIGSGMAFDYAFFKQMMLDVKAIGGFDKEIELKMLQAGLKIDYLEDAILLDEKVQNSDAFTTQRRRWLSAQFFYFKQDIGPAVRDLFLKGNIDYFFKALQFLLIPRVLLLGLVIGSTFIFLLINLISGMAIALSLNWIVVFASCVLAFFFAVPLKFYNKQTARALLMLPKGMLLMLKSLLRIRGANKSFLHTPHGNQKPK